MYLSKLVIKNFRGIKEMALNFNRSINILIGENGSNKSAVIDAIRLLYNMGEPIRDISVGFSDFHETIESDAERLKRNQEVYTIIKPTNVPRRTNTNIPNVVAYALKTDNPLGTMLYERRFKSQARFERNCNRYVSDSSAQEAFLLTGGPERDQFGIDPDGDGFACRWDPTPFRLAVGK